MMEHQNKTSGAILVLQSPDRFIIEYASKLDFIMTNNEAKYEALMAGLGWNPEGQTSENLGDLRLVISEIRCKRQRQSM